ncbi:MAG: MATE family efflux transporter [Pseudomonadota bacterium]|nr:MATE family efflux transporter [Pseudomonadota bacterium]
MSFLKLYFSSVDKQTLKIALPLILSNITIPLVGLVDNAVMGHLGSPIYIGAVGIGSIIISYILFSFGFFKSITTGLTSQYIGSNEKKLLLTSLYQILLISSFVSFLILFFRDPITLFALDLFNGSNEVKANSHIYISYRIWSIPAIFLRDIMIGYYIGTQQSRVAMTISIFINFLNIFLDYYLVIVEGYGIEGVAIASVIAEYSILFFIIFTQYKEKIFSQFDIRIKEIIGWQSLKQKVIINLDFFIRSLILMTCFAYFVSTGAKHGDIILAANAILLNFFFIFSYGLDGFAHASEALVGSAAGKRDTALIKKSILTTGKFSLILTFLYLVIFLIFDDLIISLITNLQLVQISAKYFSFWLYLIFIFGAVAFWLDGVFIGLLKNKLLRNTMIISGLVFFFFENLFNNLVNLGLWMAFLSFFITRSLLLGSLLFWQLKKNKLLNH